LPAAVRFDFARIKRVFLATRNYELAKDAREHNTQNVGVPSAREIVRAKEEEISFS
jgi:hypothetical protein